MKNIQVGIPSPNPQYPQTIYSAGEGAVGLPIEYTQLDYIESSETQYIDTGFKPNQDTAVELDYNYVDDGVLRHDWSAFGVNDLFNFTASNISPLRVKYNGVIFNSTHSTLNRFKAKLDKNKLYVDGILENTYTYANFSCSYNALLFARINNSNGALQERSKMRLYNCKMWDNGTLIRNFIPCYRNSDKEAGLYDLVNNVFYTNQGTGSFIKGNVVGITKKIVNKNLIPTNVNDWEQGSISGSGSNMGQPVSSTTRIRTKEYYAIKPNTYYYVSVEDTNYCFINIFFYDKDNNFVNQYYAIDNLINGATSRLIRIPISNEINKTITKMRVVLRKSDNTSTITPSEITSIKPMITEGSTATEYVAHAEQNFTIPCQQPMKDLKDESENIIKSDRFVKINGNWFEQHWIKTRILNGNEVWSKVNNSFQVPATTTPDKDDVTIPALSNYFRFKYYATAITTNLQDGEFGWNSVKLLTMRNDSCANETAFKTWLENLYANGTPVYIDYGLTESTDLPCTAEQTQALETYIKARTYKNVTHFYSEDETPAYQEVVYVKDLETVINQISNAITALGGV